MFGMVNDCQHSACGWTRHRGRDPTLADRLAAVSAERYGRNVLDVELDLQAAAERVRHSGSAPQTDQENAASGKGATGTPSSARTPTGGQVPRPRRASTSRKAGGRPSRARSALERGVAVMLANGTRNLRREGFEARPKWARASRCSSGKAPLSRCACSKHVRSSRSTRLSAWQA